MGTNEIRSHGLSSSSHLVPSGYVKIAVENGHLWLIYLLKMVIFHSYVSLPEGNFKGLYHEVTAIDSL